MNVDTLAPQQGAQDPNAHFTVDPLAKGLPDPLDLVEGAPRGKSPENKLSVENGPEADKPGRR